MNTTLRIRLLGLIPALLLCHGALWGQLILPTDQAAMEPPVCPKGGGAVPDTSVITLRAQVVTKERKVEGVTVSLEGVPGQATTGPEGWFYLAVPASQLPENGKVVFKITYHTNFEFVPVGVNRLLSTCDTQLKVHSRLCWLRPVDNVLDSGGR